MSGMPYVSTTNACKLCTPLGAALAFKGVQGCIPFLHGSQGCATYMRRYVISHFREPIDIASSSLGEKHAIYGGGPNLKKGLVNVLERYQPEVVGVATTCLTETIGDDVAGFLAEFFREFSDLDLPEVVNVSTPSYTGTHMDGFHNAVAALCRQLCTEKTEPRQDINLFPGFVSTEDLRHLDRICRLYGLRPAILPDFSRTLDGPALDDYEILPSGGTPLSDLRAMGAAKATLECGRLMQERKSAGKDLNIRFRTDLHTLGMPIGLRETDVLHRALQEISGMDMPEPVAEQRGRLLDAYADGHKYLFDKRVIVYGEADLVIGLCAFLAEIGMRPVLCATGEKTAGFGPAIEKVCSPIISEMPRVRTGIDFHELEEEARHYSPDLLLGHSKGYHLARKLDIPLLRVGFPLHDRFGGQRFRHLGYAGAAELFDRLVNTFLELKQAGSDVGYGYL